jgi:hypothetical protein
VDMWFVYAQEGGRVGVILVMTTYLEAFFYTHTHIVGVCLVARGLSLCVSSDSHIHTHTHSYTQDDNHNNNILCMRRSFLCIRRSTPTPALPTAYKHTHTHSHTPSPSPSPWLSTSTHARTHFLTNPLPPKYTHNTAPLSLPYTYEHE